MKNDICRKKLVEISRQQAEQVARLMTLAHGRQYHIGSCDLENCFWDCIWASVGGGTHHCLRIVAELLLPTGTFCPKDWLSGYPAEQAGHTKTRDIIRAAFQKPMVWTCTKLPDLNKLHELVRAMGPDKWDIGTDAESVVCGRYLPDGSEYPEDVFALTKGVRLGSGLLTARTTQLKRNRTESPVRIRLTCDAILRFSCFLPHLIALAGGEVEFD